MNIFICGVPRSGKTTLARKLKEALTGYNFIVSESIRNGFQKMDKGNYKKWGNRNSLQRKQQFPEFIFEFLKWNSFFSECDNIVDLGLVDLKTVVDNKEDSDLVICLGFGDISDKEILSFMRKRENKGDYTEKLNDEELMNIWGNIFDGDKENIKLCNQYKIKYFNVLKNEDMVNYVLNNMIKNVKEI